MTWIPMQKGEPNPGVVAAMGEVGVDTQGLEVWGNDRYQVIARTNDAGMTWLSIKTHDRAPIRNWRHLQQIKNEVCGEEREGVELFPAESRLADGANEYHLWVFPEGFRLPFGFQEGLVSTDEQQRAFTDSPHQGRQEPWEPGLTTGRNANTRYMTDEEQALVDHATQGARRDQVRNLFG